MGANPAIVIKARAATLERDNPVVSLGISGDVLSDGEFVYGPNVGNFDIQAYLLKKAPQLAQYADDLNGRAYYYSINPRIYLTLLEVRSHLISNPDPSKNDDPFGLKSGGFFSQIDEISTAMVSAYYLHLYTYSAIPGKARKLPPVATAGGESIAVSPETNAGSYGVMAALALIEDKTKLPTILDNNQPDGFYQTYQRLFPNKTPTSETNQVYYPGSIGAQSVPVDLLQLQLPYLKGESWIFNGVHDAAGGNVGDPFVNAASIDFSPSWPAWGVDTSKMWVAAAASGVPNKVSNCSFRIDHGNGWETSYYHLDNIQIFSGWINQNDKIGVIANNLAQAICNGGFSTGPHLHLSLRRNGVFVAINGTPLSGWYIHSGRWNYDNDPNYMWLERFGVKKVAGNPLLSESPALITKISAGAAHSCAQTSVGGIKCWGSNVSGQLGDGSTTNRLTPVNVSGISSGIGAIASGWNHTCALAAGGAVKCWGNNSSGQLGDGTTTNRTSPVNVTGFSTSGAAAISGGQLHTCLLTNAGGVKCWGDNASGQLGNGTTTNAPTPTNVVGLASGIKKISAGRGHTCALTTAGGVKCWGDNTSGQLGNGSTTNASSPVDVTGLSSGVLAISAGFDQTCAITSAGAVKCWGSNATGQLGNGTTTNASSPVDVTGLTGGMISVSSGHDFSCALSSTGTVKCWGSNATGQLGNGTNISQLTPVDVIGLPGGVVSISTGGGDHTCSLTSSGTAQCWGGNAFGQLGDGTTTPQATPVTVKGLTYKLDVIKPGTGAGTVTSSPAGINCGPYCSATYLLGGTSITLTAIAARGSTFNGWSGEGCSGISTCTVSMTAARSVSAIFTFNTYALSASKTGNGTITSSPAGINCGTDCSELYNYGTRVTLTATPDPGWVLSTWGGRCLGSITLTCTVIVDEAKSVSVSFTNITYPLSLAKTGNGAGTVTSSPAGINCGSTCSYSFGNHSLVLLTATASTGSIFTGWSGGGCSGTGTCKVTMNTPVSVTANFTANSTCYTLTLTPATGGSITASPTPNCNNSSQYFQGTAISLTATPDTGWAFSSWGGSCLGVTTNICSFVMDDNKTVSVLFTSNTYTLTLNKTGTGSGIVTSSPTGINCGSTCSYSFGNNSLVLLTATASTGSTFTGWSGGGCSGTGTCTVTMNTPASVTANFTLNTYTLSASKTGNGTITSSPAGINCGTDCSELYNYGTRVTLTATPDTGWAFNSWGGSCLGVTTNICSFVMDDNKTVSVLFTSNTYTLTLNKAGTGSGMVTSSPTGINCGSTCSYAFASTTIVTLTAIPSSDSVFIGWSGDSCSGTGTCILTMSSSKSINANFDAAPGTFNKSLPATGTTNAPVSLTLSWGASSGATSYEYCFDTTNDNACTTWVTNGTATSKLLSDLTPNTIYYWQVRAINSTGTTYADGTAFWSFTTTIAGSLPGAFLKTAPINGNINAQVSLTLSWGASSGVTSYEYCYDTTNDNACTTWVNNGTASSKLLSDLTPNTIYYWQVRAINPTGTTYADGTASSFWNFKTGILPGAFLKTAPINGTINAPVNLTLSWGASSGVTSYEFCYDTTNDNACTTWVTNGTATSKLMSGLSPNTTYYWQVRAINTIGTTYSNASSTAFWSFTTTTAGSLPGNFNKFLPANLSSGLPTALTFSWGSSSGATSYAYCYDKTNDNTCSNWIGIGMATSAMLSDLSLNTTYYWHVRAINASGTTYSNGSSDTFWNFKTIQ